MSRACTLRITQLKVIPSPLSAVSMKESNLATLLSPQYSITIGAALNSNRKLKLQSNTSIDLNGASQISLDLMFQIQYSHYLKDPSANLLRISIESRKKTGAFGRQKTLGKALIDLDEVLQQPFRGKVTLMDGNDKGKLTPFVELDVSIDTLPRYTLVDHVPDGEEGEHQQAEDDSSTSDDEVEVHGYRRKEKDDSAKTDITKQFYKFKKALESKLKSVVSHSSGDAKGPAAASDFKDDYTSEEEEEEGATTTAATATAGESRLETTSPTLKLESRISYLFESLKAATIVSAVNGPTMHSPIPSVLMVNSLTSRGKKFCDWIKLHQSNKYSALWKIAAPECILQTGGSGEVMGSLRALISQYQKMSEMAGMRVPPIKIGILGNDGYVNDVLRSYVKLLEAKPRSFDPLRIYVIPLGNECDCCVARYLCNQSTKYCELFSDSVWRDAFDRPQRTVPWNETLGLELLSRIMDYMSSADMVVQMPIAEANISYPENVTSQLSSPSEKSGADRSMLRSNSSFGAQQRSVPFIQYVSVAIKIKEVEEISFKLPPGSAAATEAATINVDLDYWSYDSDHIVSLKERDKPPSVMSSIKTAKQGLQLLLVTREPLPKSDTSSMASVASKEVVPPPITKIEKILKGKADKSDGRSSPPTLSSSLPGSSVMREKVGEIDDFPSKERRSHSHDFDARDDMFDDCDSELMDGVNDSGDLDEEGESIVPLPSDMLLLNLFSPKLAADTKESKKSVTKLLLTHSRDTPFQLHPLSKDKDGKSLPQAPVLRKGWFHSPVNKILLALSGGADSVTLFIDGVEFQGTQLVSITPNWVGPVKTFPIAIFSHLHG